MADDGETHEAETLPKSETFAKKRKQVGNEKTPGVIYMSRIPTGMNVKKVRQIMNEYGEVGRIFLQPNEKTSSHRKSRSFTEGWVEFLEKKVAKQVSLTLNNTMVGGKKRAPYHDELWNIKYLSRFKWGHLNERLAYEQAVRRQRLRTEIAQVKKQSNFFIQNVEKSAALKKKEKKGKVDLSEQATRRDWEFKQRDTEDDIIAKRRKLDGQSFGKKYQSDDTTTVKKAGLSKSFLQSLFSGGVCSTNEK